MWPTVELRSREIKPLDAEEATAEERRIAWT
jgi:hypothetical protein